MHKYVYKWLTKSSRNQTKIGQQPGHLVIALDIFRFLPESWLSYMQADYIINFSSYRWPVAVNKACNSTYVNGDNKNTNYLLYEASLTQTE